LTTAKITDARGFCALKDQWNHLLANSPSDCLFLTWEWLFTWWKHLAGRRELRILKVLDRDRLVGIAPLAASPRLAGRFSGIQMLEFLGTGDVGSDYLDVIAQRGREREVVDTLAHHLSGGDGVLDLARLNPGNCASTLAARLGRSDWRILERSTEVSPYIELRGHCWESYLATLGTEHRYALRRKLRRLLRRYEVRFEPAESEAQCRESIDLLLRLHHLRWNERGGSQAFHRPELEAFHREFSQVARDRGWLRLFVLRLDDKPAAALYGFRYGNVFYFYQSGFDPKYSGDSVGVVTMGLAIRKALEEGVDEFDLLHGDESYKRHWTRQQRNLVRLRLYPPRLTGWLWRQSDRLENASRKVARRVLPQAVRKASALAGLLFES
jgi:CelD/BcsL family acetyltransferase involved in cellulose biosynthesis